MPKFSNRSMTNLNSCHLVLRRVMSLAIEKADFTVLCGHRGQEEQEAAFEAGNSKLRWPRSKHNMYLSHAVDIAPYPIDWHDEARFIALSGEVKRAWGAMTEAAKQGYELSWGGDWVSFRDLPHWELRSRRGQQS
jgi:peptidoglycan L-alanyl-D-glutamate endopeptidase CwlK